MTSSTQTYVTGLFPDRVSAERAYERAHARGYDVGDVNMVMNDETRKRHFGAATETTELGNKAAEGAGIGGAIGGTVGAVAAAIAAVGTSLVLPGIGLVVAGPIAAALAGAGAGGATGGIIGALIGWGIPEERVKQYDEGRMPFELPDQRWPNLVALATSQDSESRQQRVMSGRLLW